MEPKRKLFNRDFSLMVVGQVISQFGHSILSFALSLYVLDLTGSATLFGGVLAVSTVPRILFAPVGGVLADRLPRHRIMYVLDFLTAVAVWNFGLYGRNGSPVPPAALMMALAVVSACYYPSVSSSTPLLVPAEELTRANSVTSQVNALSGLLGPILGGIVYGFWGIGSICLVSGGCFLTSAVMECFLRIPFQPQASRGGGLTTAVADLKEAGTFLSRSGLLTLLFVFAAVNFLFNGCCNVALPYHLKITLGLSSQLYSLVESAAAAGSILGATLVGILGTRLSFYQNWKYAFFATLPLAFTALVLIRLDFPLISWAVILLAWFAGMVFNAFLNILHAAFVQQITPTPLLGKVSSLSSMCCQCVIPLGQGAYGLLVASLPPWCVFLFTFAASLPLVALIRSSLNKFQSSEIKILEI